MLSSLCFPDRSKSCFACCPPIRPVAYDHYDYKNIINRILLENTRKHNLDDREVRPITGFSCWAMGYIDSQYKQAGCLLHPFQNNGNDLRFRIDYGNKCTREGCHEAKIFETLEDDEKIFWLSLSQGMDSFEYSSRKINILFDLLGWGSKVLSSIANNESGRDYDKSGFLERYPFLKTDLLPKGYAYLLTYITDEKGPEILKNQKFEKLFKQFSMSLLSEIGQRTDISDGPVYVHKMDFDVLFTDFLRLSLKIKKSEHYTVEKIKQFTDNRLKIFCRGV